MAHVFAPERGGQGTPGGPIGHARGGVVAHPDGGAQLRTEADKPGVTVVVGGAGFTGDRASNIGSGGCTAQNDPFHDFGELLHGLCIKGPAGYAMGVVFYDFPKTVNNF